MATLIELKTF